MNKKYVSQIFTGEYDGSTYCDFDATSAQATAGKDIILAIWDATGANILAVAGQQDLSIKRSADTLEVTTKDTEGGYKSYLAGTKEWSIDLSGVYVTSDKSQKQLSTAFESGDAVCIKVYNKKAKKGMFGGLAVVTDFSIEAANDGAMTYSITLSGLGKLTDFSVDAITTDKLPE